MVLTNPCILQKQANGLMHQMGHKETSVHPSSLRARDNKILGNKIINASLRPKSQPSGPRYKHITFSSTAVPHSMPPPSGQNACSQRPNTHHVVPPVPLKSKSECALHDLVTPFQHRMSSIFALSVALTSQTYRHAHRILYFLQSSSNSPRLRALTSALVPPGAQH